MNNYLLFIIQTFQTSISTVLVFLILFYIAIIIITIAYSKYTKKKPISLKIITGVFFITCYLCLLVHFTLYRNEEHVRIYNLHAFSSWTDAWNHYSLQGWLNLYLNIALFIPIGLLIPLFFDKSRKLYIVCVLGISISLTIEILQLALCVGVFDIDDLLNNTIGTIIGYLIATIINSLHNVKANRILLIKHGAILFIITSILSSIFIIYEVKEYGNLPELPTYRVNTADVNWNISCDHSNESGFAAIYKLDSPTLDEVNSFGLQFAECVGAIYDDITVYNDETHFMDRQITGGRHFLVVSHSDLSFDYSYPHPYAITAHSSRKEIEELLLNYNITIPNRAEFTLRDDGWHFFEINNETLDGSLWNGYVACQYSADGSLLHIINKLNVYDYYSKTIIISEASAIKKLMDGYISDADFFEANMSENVIIASISLKYTIDTKGFYQPVYAINLISEDSMAQMEAIIPAVK